VVVGVGEAGLDLLALCLQAGEAGADLAGGPGGVGGQVEEVFLLPVQGRQFPGELVVQELAAGGALGEHGVHVGADLADERLWQSLGCPVGLDGVFDVLDGQVGQVAAAGAAGQAPEVAVGAAAAAGGLGVDQPAVATSRVAAGAPQAAFEVVVMDTSPFPGHAGGVQQGLNLLEDLGLDQRLVAAGVLGALVGDDAEVVPVP
jgi:hypothetical protein